MQSLESKVERARSLFEGYKFLSERRDAVYWKQAEILYELKKKNLFKFVHGGEQTQTWTSFCAENGIATSSANQKIGAWEYFVIARDFDPADMQGADTSCLYYITRYCPDASKEEVTQRIIEIKTLSRGDFIQGLKGHQDCMHDQQVSETIIKCEVCNRKLGARK